jgi:Putative S-adenosyl-L-methionine-dependent methyltransferase
MSGAATLTATFDPPDATARVIEEFRPLARCLEWRVSEAYWQARGVQPFLQKEVPFLINNSGRLSDSAARLLLASCLDSPPEGRITVLEYGAGCGLFARLFLDSFRSLCAAQGLTFYQRLDMWVTDASPATIEQWTARGIFSEHAAHVTTRVLGALDDLPIENVRAAFCNYVLDSLPAALVRGTAPGVYEQLCVRTRLVEDDTVLRAHTRVTLEHLRTKAASTDPRDLANLFPLLALFEYEYAFRRDGIAAVPGISEALRENSGRPVLLNFAALQCLERLARRLSPPGFILLNDYGHSQPVDSKGLLRAERFGKTSAVRLNFPLIARALQKQELTVTTPSGDENRSVHARLITNRPQHATADAFEREFGASGARHLESLTEDARKQLSAGVQDDAITWCRSAISQSPHDWLLLGDVAELDETRDASVHDLFERADQTAYRAKREGGDRVCADAVPARSLS